MVYKQQISKVQSTINTLDNIAVEVRDLTYAERDLLVQSHDHLIKILREEEIKYFQCESKGVLLGVMLDIFK
jgi:hypothetical protein